mmetsp:Transcript_33784/g.100523  ORF Transcript_33784/g.100523 Transcript_33784/m.100523 type:complete len:227 (+) Transcript_33784:1536-2216(+)
MWTIFCRQTTSRRTSRNQPSYSSSSRRATSRAATVCASSARRSRRRSRCCWCTKATRVRAVRPSSSCSKSARWSCATRYSARLPLIKGSRAITALCASCHGTASTAFSSSRCASSRRRRSATRRTTGRRGARRDSTFRSAATRPTMSSTSPRPRSSTPRSTTRARRTWQSCSPRGSTTWTAPNSLARCSRPLNGSGRSRTAAGRRSACSGCRLLEPSPLTAEGSAR